MEVRIEKQKDGSYIAYNTGDEKFVIIGTGDTVSEAKEDFFNSIEESKEVYEEKGLPIPCELNSEPLFHFDLSSLFEYFSMINVSAFARAIGINPTLMRQYKKGDTYISDTQLLKIEESIHSLGNELSSLKLV